MGIGQPNPHELGRVKIIDHLRLLLLCKRFHGFEFHNYFAVADKVGFVRAVERLSLVMNDQGGFSVNGIRQIPNSRANAS